MHNLMALMKGWTQKLFSTHCTFCTLFVASGWYIYVSFLAYILMCADLHFSILFEKHPRMHLIKLMKWMSVQNWDLAQDSFDLLNFVWSLYNLHTSIFVNDSYVENSNNKEWVGVSKPLTGNCVYTSATKSHWFWVYSYFLVWIFITLGCQQHVLYILYCHPAGCLWKPIITSCSNFWCLSFF